ncbi:MAG: LacI family DNA-binding transcriptional regulator [Oscillospiraceae bacterium]|nr:LacI family DNA-binding transcriptional regulator [Oscillospiraceae bacterium]
MDGKVTITDVAKTANVSIATVSRVLNQPGVVRKSTIDRVHQAMKQVGFSAPLDPAHGLLDAEPSAGQKLILIVVPNLSNPFYSAIIDGIQDSALRQNVHCILCQANKPSFSTELLFSLIHDTHASGLILLNPLADASALQHLDEILPTVQCAEYLENCNVSYVSIDDCAAGKSLVEMMISRGKRRIALINGPLRFKYARLRREGYLAALRDAGIEQDESLIINLPEISYASAFSVVTQLLNSNNPPDSCFAVSDILAAAALKAAKRSGLRVPEDFGIVGFDNTFVSTICDPSITTVSQPCYQMGFLACELLSEKMMDPLTPPKQLLLETELIIRDSL